VLVPSSFTSHVESLSKVLKFPSDQLSYTLAMFFTFPIGLIMLMLPHGKIKHTFSFISGVFILQAAIGGQWIHQLISSLVVYGIFLVMPPRLSKVVVPLFSMLYLSLGHIHRLYTSYLGGGIDFTVPQLVLTVKMYSLAYNIYDGQLIADGKEDAAAKKCKHVSVKNVPGILEYLGYTFNFSTVLAGPAFEYKIYAAVCDGSLFNSVDGKPIGKKPSNVWPTIKPFFISILCLVAYTYGTKTFPLLDPSDKQKNTPVIITEEFLSNPWLYRYFYTWVAIFTVRLKFYYAWYNAEASCNVWYGGFEGFDTDGEPKGWGNSSNVDAIGFETAPNIKKSTAAWNKKVARWLNRYVYIRTGGSLFATYSVSAFWHGFYPGYYFLFLSIPLLTFCERLGRKKLTPRFDDGNQWNLYRVLCTFVTSFAWGYLTIPFMLLAYSWSMDAWKSHFFSVHILCVVCCIILWSIPLPKVKSV